MSITAPLLSTTSCLTCTIKSYFLTSTPSASSLLQHQHVFLHFRARHQGDLGVRDKNGMENKQTSSSPPETRNHSTITDFLFPLNFVPGQSLCAIHLSVYPFVHCNFVRLFSLSYRNIP
jgi:hypothetical protein